jgi:hypothetical protein
MFTYRKFGIEIRRNVDAARLGWPKPDEARNDSGLGCNREYIDLRRRSWADAKRVYALERTLIARLENGTDVEEELAAIEEELYEDPGDDLFGLDLGVASSVICLSAAGCVTFASCNAGAFGGRHHERYPLVAFFARPQMIAHIDEATGKAGIGLENSASGHLIAYANDIRDMRRFAKELIKNARRFAAINVRTTPRRAPPTAHKQDTLPF